MTHNLPFRIVEHSGDLRIVASGTDLLEAIANASLALLSQIVPPQTVAEVEQMPIKVTGENPSDQAIAFQLHGTLGGEPVDHRLR